MGLARQVRASAPFGMVHFDTITRSSSLTREYLNGSPAAVCAGVAIWCSLGTIGLTDASTSARVALLAPWWILPLAIVAVLATIRLLRLSPREQSPLFGSTILFLPWLPIPLPPAALLWTGPFMLAVWCAVVAGVLIARMRNSRVRWTADPRVAPVVAALMSLALYGASAVWLSSILPDGDEPHYLILAQSLIKDGDLRIENNHRQGDYLAYSLTAAAPDYLRRGINGEIYSIHAPGLAFLIAPAMWLFGYPGVVAFLGLIAAMSTALVWRVGWQTTGSAACAWFGWACCALTVPFFFQATEVFPDGIAATCLLIGTLPLWDAPKPNRSSIWDAPSRRLSIGDVPSGRPMWSSVGDVPSGRPMWSSVGDVPLGRPMWSSVGDVPLGRPIWLWVVSGASL